MLYSLFSSRNADPNILTANLDGIRRDRNDGRQAQHLACLHVKASTVSRTFNLIAEQLAFAERPVIVRAQVGDRVKLSVDIAEANSPAARLEHLHLSCRDVGYFGYFHEFADSHSIQLLVYPEVTCT
jgi:hypothetical protein